MHEVLKCYDLMIRVQKKVIMRLNLERFSSLFPLEILRFLTPSFEKLLNLWKIFGQRYFYRNFSTVRVRPHETKKVNLLLFAHFGSRWKTVQNPKVDGPKEEKRTVIKINIGLTLLTLLYSHFLKKYSMLFEMDWL